MGKNGEALEHLIDVMRRLRAGCPWDREQDIRSLRPYLIEECYEVLDEMDRVAYGGPRSDSRSGVIEALPRGKVTSSPA